MIVEYTKLESIHSALQELQNRYAIPDNDVDLNNALQFTEDLREPHLKENENEWSNTIQDGWVDSQGGWCKYV